MVLKSVKSQTVLWLNINEKAFGFPFIMGAVYIPPEPSKYYDESMFDDIATDLIKLNNLYNLPFCLLGDFNARTGLESELEYGDSVDCSNNYYLDNSESTVPNQHFSHCDISLVRYNRDKEINNHGNKFLEICRGFNLIIVNGRVGTDKRIGDLTCANASTIDYCVASPELFDAFNDFFV